MKASLLRKFQRDGDWWGQRTDGSWVRWNSSRSDWEDYPIAPPGEYSASSNEGVLSSVHSFPTKIKRPLGPDLIKVYGFLFSASLAVGLTLAAGLALLSFIVKSMHWSLTPITIREVAIEAPTFVLVWVSLVGAASVVLMRTSSRNWTAKMVAVSLITSAAITLAHWGLEARWVTLNPLNVVKGWIVLMIIGWVWQSFGSPGIFDSDIR